MQFRHFTPWASLVLVAAAAGSGLAVRRQERPAHPNPAPQAPGLVQQATVTPATEPATATLVRPFSVRVVASDERSVLRALRWAFGTTVRHFGSLFWFFFRISLVAWAEMAVLFWVWMDFVPQEHIGLSFLLGQIALLLWLAARFWQRGGETIWYERKLETIAPL